MAESKQLSVKEVLQQIISNKDHETNSSVNIVAKRVLASLNAGNDYMNHILASGGGKEGGITILNGLQYIIEHSKNNKDSEYLNNYLKSLDSSEKGKEPSQEIKSDNLEENTLSISPKLSKKKRRNKGRNKKKLEQAFAEAIARDEPDEILNQTEKPRTVINAKDLFSSTPQSLAQNTRTLRHQEVASTSNQAEEEAPEDLNFLTLSADQRKKALQNIKKQAESASSSSPPPPPPPPPTTTTTASSTTATASSSSSSSSSTTTTTISTISPGTNENITMSETDHTTEKVLGDNKTTMKDESTIVPTKTVEKVLNEAMVELSGDMVFRPMRKILDLVINALKQNKTLEDTIDISDDQEEENTNGIKDNDDDEEESFFEPPSRHVGNTLSLLDALEYVVRSCMVKTALKVAQALTELKKLGGNLQSIIPISAKKNKTKKPKK